MATIAGTTMLEERFRGELLRPGDARYDVARRVWNGAIDKYPALIARCTGIDDVIAALRHARENDLLVAVRGGGHSIPGHSVCEGGVVIDLGPMKEIEIDPARQTARVEGGVVWGELDRATQEHGLATNGGQVSTTGIAGLTLGGGIGWLARKHGLTCDNLLAAEVVTADGDVVRASADENTDLFWGLRGGGGNFGIVTSFEYRLYPLGPVLGGLVVHPASRAEEVLRFYRDFAADSPDELTTYAVFFTAPPEPPFPEHLQGQIVVALAPCYAGRLDEGERLLRPLREFGPPSLDLVGPMPYVALQSMQDEWCPPGLQTYAKSDHLNQLTDDAIATIAAGGTSMTSPLTQVVVVQLGGAVARVANDETAYVHRDAAYNYILAPFWTDPAESEGHVGWTRGFWEAMRPFASGVYVNFLVEEGENRIKEAYDSATYGRLRALKRKYDPENVFQLNQNIPPTG